MNDPLYGYFTPFFTELQAEGLDLEKVLWVVPRVESGASLKREWMAFSGQKAVLAPVVVPADRMSQPRAKRPWLSYQAQIASLLNRKPDLIQGLSGEQVWVLAQEYLGYAFRLVLVRQAAASLEKYMQMGPFAERETQFILEVSKIYETQLSKLQFKPDPTWSRFEQIVWFNDGETLPKHWLSAYLPDLPVRRIDLPLIQGVEPWNQLIQNQATGSIKLTVAANENSQAQQAAALVSDWLRADPESTIAIAVSDRLAARRLVPVLSELGIQVDDRTGWRLSISALAGWFNGLLELVAEGNSLTVLPHPFTHELISNPKANLLSRATSLADQAQAWLGVLEHADLLTPLRNDAAGTLLLGVLRDLAQIDSDIEVSAQEFAQACQYQMENIRFKPLDVKSPVSMMPLLTTRLRRFKRVLVLGCAQSQFQESPPGLLPPSVAHELGFPGPSLGRAQRISALWELAGQSTEVVFSHSAKTAGGPESLLPELQYLDLLIKQKFEGRALHQFSPRWLQQWADLRVQVVPADPEPLNLNALDANVAVPKKLRVTALDDFAACPLRFGLNRVLPFPDVRESSGNEFFALRGSFVHKVFERATLTMASGRNQTDFEQWIEPLQDAVTSSYLELDLSQQATLYPFKIFFGSLIPRIAGRLAARASDGWQVQNPEQDVTGLLNLAGGQSIKLRGRVDRMEQKASDTAIVDIKFKSANQLKKLVKEPLSYPQLPAYQALLGLHSAKLHYLAIDKDSVEWIEIPPPDENAEFASWGEALWAQLNKDMDDFFNGSRWTMRPGEACSFCSASGVCRPQGVELSSEEQP